VRQAKAATQSGASVGIDAFKHKSKKEKKQKKAKA
jgi:hypothetical protein